MGERREGRTGEEGEQQCHGMASLPDLRTPRACLLVPFKLSPQKAGQSFQERVGELAERGADMSWVPSRLKSPTGPLAALSGEGGECGEGRAKIGRG